MIRYFFIRKKVAARIVGLAFLLFNQQASAQKAADTADIFLYNKIADTVRKSFDLSKPYYIGIWKEGVPRTLNILRRLTEMTAVVEIKSQFILDSLKQHAKIAAANDQWKYSPFAERIIGGMSNDLRLFILSASDLNTLVADLKNHPARVNIIMADEHSRSVLARTTARFL